MYQNDWRFSGIIAIILPLLSIFIQGNQFYWISFRIFCLSLTLLVSSTYPKLYQILHGNIYQNITDFTEKEYKNYKYIFSLISLILSILVINQNNKSIFLDYFYS